MDVDWNQSLEGLSLLEVRNFLDRNGSFPADLKKNYSGLPKTKYVRLVRALVRCNLLELDEDGSAPRYRLTPSGMSLLCAKKIKGISRQKADVEIAALLQRVPEINAECPVQVAELYVYGSYLDTTRSTINDIDIAFRENDCSHGEEFKRLCEEFDERHPSQRWQWWYSSNARNWMIRRLKNRKQCISITTSGELERLGCARRRIYPTVEDIPADPDWKMPERSVQISD